MKLSLRTLSLATVAAAALAVAPAAYADTNYTIGNTAPGTIGGPLGIVSNSVTTPNYTVGYTAAAFRDADGITIDFFYHITSFTDIPPSTDNLNRLSMSIFSISDLLNVEAAGAGNAPDSTAILHSNGVLDVNYNTNPIMNGMTSQNIWLVTNATQFDFGTFAAADGFVAQLQGYDPVTTTLTPEPGTFALMGTGLLAAASAIRRRVKA